MNLYELTDAKCGCKQHPSFVVPQIWHTCRKPRLPGQYLRDLDRLDEEWQVMGCVADRPVFRPSRAVYDALAEEEARAPITRYMRGGVPEHLDDEAFMFPEGGRHD